MSWYQRSSGPLVSGWSLQNPTSVFRAITRTPLYGTFPRWDQSPERSENCSGQSFAWFCREQGRDTEARDLLAPVYCQFTEGLPRSISKRQRRCSVN
jgi:hypothetical protein